MTILLNLSVLTFNALINLSFPSIFIIYNQKRSRRFINLVSCLSFIIGPLAALIYVYIPIPSVSLEVNCMSFLWVLVGNSLMKDLILDVNDPIEIRRREKRLIREKFKEQKFIDHENELNEKAISKGYGSLDDLRKHQGYILLFFCFLIILAFFTVPGVLLHYFY